MLATNAGTTQPLDGFLIERLRGGGLAEQGTAPRFDAETPVGVLGRVISTSRSSAARAGPVTAADRRLDEFRQRDVERPVEPSRGSITSRAAASASSYWPSPLRSNAVTQ